MSSDHDSLNTVEVVGSSSPSTTATASDNEGTTETTTTNNNSAMIPTANTGGEDGDNAEQQEQQRTGTTSSARFNILCTMVGGGCLSLPMAFQLTGNGLFGPLLLLLTAAITEYCFRIIVAAARQLSPITTGGRSATVVGSDTFETLASAAFGAKGFLFAKWLVTAMCFFGAVGYAVLLRDMLQPITDAISHNNDSAAANNAGGGPSLASNMTMLTVLLLITPVCGLKTLSALKDLGAASMGSVLILGCCIVYRSLQCNFGQGHGQGFPAFQLFPDNAKDVLGKIKKEFESSRDDA